MNFVIDKQTLDDLTIFGRGKSSSVYAIFNTTHTRGAARIMEEMFMQPLTDPVAIEKRASAIEFFRQHEIEFPFRGAWFDAAEYYLANTDERTRVEVSENTLSKKFQRVMGSDSEFQMIRNGITAIVDIMSAVGGFVKQTGAAGTTVDGAAGTTGATGTAAPPPSLIENLRAIEEISQAGHFEIARSAAGNSKPSMEMLAALDSVFRYQYRGEVLDLLHRIYILDIYVSVARTARSRGFVHARVLSPQENVLSIEGLFHPHLSAPVANTIEITDRSNVIFLTGANMAGKSTFMKSLGIAVFLAHVGFPVPASKMSFSVRNGMYTSINLPDNLSHGYSHFYAEVLRLKKVATAVNHYQNMVVIFDELFRGTNVKDAYDATIAVTEAFASIGHCVFVISTHIIESGDILRERADNINFVYFPTKMSDNRPVYTYTLSQGITDDRHGMMIINNEKILDILSE